MDRMDRGQFFDKLALLDEERLKKALWNLYWRGTAAARQRIEAELDPDGHRRQRVTTEAVDPQWTLYEVGEFVELARSGAYLAGDRRVTPRERTRWRFTFQRLVKDAELALRDDDIADGAAAMALLLDLAQEMRSYDYFRSEDPIEAARVVVSDEVALLWSCVQERLGFAELARSAAPQLVRWESDYGWTRTGSGRVREKETSLAAVLGRMLTAPDMWFTFADRYLEALDAVTAAGAATTRHGRYSSDRGREQRAGDLAEWNLVLLDRLSGGDVEDRLDRLATHPALGGPDLTYFRARLAHRRGEQAAARRLVSEALERLPGHQDYLGFANEIGAPLPARAEEANRARLRRLMSDGG
jgi:hypothetical protein